MGQAHKFQHANLNFPSADARAAPSVMDETEGSDTVSGGSSSSCGAVPDFSWQGMSAAVDFQVDIGGAKKRARTEPQEEEAEGKEEEVAASGDHMLFDAFMFGGDQFSFFSGRDVYGPAATAMDDGLLGGDGAVLCEDSDSVGLWSFDDSVCYY